MTSQEGAGLHVRRHGLRPPPRPAPAAGLQGRAGPTPVRLHHRQRPAVPGPARAGPLRRPGRTRRRPGGGGGKDEPMHDITPCLWFDTQAEEAARFYTSVFPDSRVLDVARYGEAGPRPAGTVMTVDFELD